MKESNTIVNDIWFSDKQHFYLNGIMKKKMLATGAMKNQIFHPEKPDQGEKTVWAAMSSRRVIGISPNQDESGETQIV